MPWNAGRLALLASAVAAGMMLWVGLLVLQATLSFWTIETLEIMNTLTYGGVETAQFPLSIYSRGVPAVLRVRGSAGLRLLLPRARDPRQGRPPRVAPVARLGLAAAGPLFLAATLRVFRLGVRHYTSTGS